MPNVIIPEGGLGVITSGLVSEYVNPSAPTTGIVYTSKSERWDSIAYKMYGDSTQITPLIVNNPGVPIQDTVDAGTQLFVPIITPVSSAPTNSPWG